MSSENGQSSQTKTLTKKAYKWREYIEQTSNEEYMCKVCCQISENKVELKKHVGVGACFQCLDCLKKFCYQTQLEGHKFVHSEEKTCVFDECGVMFKTETHVNRHKTLAHQSDMEKLLKM